MASLKIWQDTERDLYAALYCIDRPSGNKKTGDMVQLAILPLSKSPTETVKDKTQHNCGDCALKSSCYVNPVSLNAVYETTVRLDVSPIPQLCKPVRLGSWGDPGLLPISVLHCLVHSAPGHTGYTHLWQDISTEYAQYLMASIDALTAHNAGLTLEQLKRSAQRAGYRTYTILSPGQSAKGDIICPATKRSIFGRDLTCRECTLCSGNMSVARSIAAEIHGAPNKVRSYLKQVV